MFGAMRKEDFNFGNEDYYTARDARRATIAEQQRRREERNKFLPLKVEAVLSEVRDATRRGDSSIDFWGNSFIGGLLSNVDVVGELTCRGFIVQSRFSIPVGETRYTVDWSK